ncbi:MAG TPA: hypothetical protein PK504_11750 [Ferruginibacter sp.]|nr:hypothetical protein [Ferruginibacter sp.]
MFVDYESNENLKLQTLDSKKTYIFNLTESQLKEIDERALIDAKAKYKGINMRPGPCPQMTSASAIVSRIERSCNNPNVSIVTFQWRIIEREAYAYSLNYNFKLSTGIIVDDPVFPNLINISEPDCDETFDYCLVLKTFELTMSIQDYDLSGSWSSSVGATCALPGSGTNTILTPSKSYGFTQNDYINSPARVFVSVAPYGFVSISTECGYSCYASYIICPSAATFRYRLLNSGNPWTNVSFNIYSATPIGPLSMGDYEYETSLTYIFGGFPNVVYSNGIFTVY